MVGKLYMKFTSEIKKNNNNEKKYISNIPACKETLCMPIL